MKTLIRVPLNELRTYDAEVAGSVYRKDGRAYRWVKNAGATALKAAACCLQMITGVEGGMNTRVVAPDGAAAATSVISLPAGKPMTAIGASGTDTGDWGWIQCQGYAKVTLAKSSAAMVAGAIAVGTSGMPATHPWGRVEAPDLDGLGADATGAFIVSGRRVVLMQAIAATNPATAVSCLVDIQCL